MTAPTPSPDYERLRAILVTTARHAPNMPLGEAMTAIIAVEEELIAHPGPTAAGPSIKTLRDLADFAIATPSVAVYMDPIAGVKKINAIKELRMVVSSECDAATAAKWGGLKECKDAVELAWPSVPF